MYRGEKYSKHFWITIHFLNFWMTLIDSIFFIHYLAESLPCFIHNVSAVKKGQLTGNQYMELTIQSENWSKSAICMSPQKKKRLDAAMISKSPVKLRKFNLAKGKVFISDATEINSVDPETLNFTHNAKLATDAIVSLKDLESLASGQFVNVKANIHKIGELVTHALRDGKEVSKRRLSSVMIKHPDCSLCMVKMLTWWMKVKHTY